MWGNCCFFMVLSVFFFDFEKTAMVQKLKSTIYPSWEQSARAQCDCTQWIDDSLSENIDIIAQNCAPPTFEILLQNLVTFWFFTPMLPDKWVKVMFLATECLWFRQIFHLFFCFVEFKTSKHCLLQGDGMYIWSLSLCFLNPHQNITFYI